MDKPIGHKTYLEKLKTLVRVFRTHDSTQAALESIENNPLYTVLLDEIREHHDSCCKTCISEDEQYGNGGGVPDEECAAIGIGLDWLKPIYQCRKTAEMLVEKTRTSGALRAIVSKYHASLPLHEIEMLKGNDLIVALNVSLDRIMGAVLARDVETPPSSPRTRLVL